MNRISMYKNLFKARFGSFTEKEFDALCNEYSANMSGFFANKNQAARRVLATFFRHQTPLLSELNTVYKGGDELKWLYLGNISKKRELTDFEQNYLASFMNFGPIFRFPKQMNDTAVKRLFDSGDIDRISTYVRDFALPERYELELIRRYAMQKPCTKGSWGKRDYRCALEFYLEKRKPGRCQSFSVQVELLKVADESLWEKLCAGQSMSENVLSENTIRELITKKYAKAMKTLLLNSFMPTTELQRYLLHSFPELKWELEISKVRHALRKLEIETGHYWGVEAPSCEELKLINSLVSSDDDREEISNIISRKIKANFVTPYFYAWMVNECPSLGEEAYTNLRKFAENYRKKYGKNA